MAAPSRPPLTKGLVLGSKVLAALAGGGALLGAAACGVALVGTPETGAPSYSGPAFFGFFVLLASAGVAYLALTLYALGLATDPRGTSAARVVLALGGGLALLFALYFLLGFSGNAGPFARSWYPAAPVAALLVIAVGLAMWASPRRGPRG